LIGFIKYTDLYQAQQILSFQFCLYTQLTAYIVQDLSFIT